VFDERPEGCLIQNDGSKPVGLIGPAVARHRRLPPVRR
jgi:hypothetical protein